MRSLLWLALLFTGCYRSHELPGPASDASVPRDGGSEDAGSECGFSPGRDVELAAPACGLMPTTPAWCVWLEFGRSATLSSVTFSSGPVSGEGVECLGRQLVGRCYPERYAGTMLEVCPLF